MSEAIRKKNGYVDILRALFCLSVLFYHIGVLKGGYIAVCGFFALSGYLGCRSVMKKDFSLTKHYLGRLLKIYLPLAVTVLVTLLAVSFLPGISWVSEKPESVSVLLGYNNFWQISANLDYFARHTESPFMHFWYIAILLQIELVFPLVMLVLKKIGEKAGRALPCVLLNAAAIASSAYFIHSAAVTDAMNVYYGTFTRVFSFIIGAAAAYDADLLGDKIRKGTAARVLFLLLVFGMIPPAFTVEPDSAYYPAAMLGFSIAAALAAVCAFCADDGTRIGIAETCLHPIAALSYEVYLVQYPVLYIYDRLFGETASVGARTASIAAASFLIAAVLHFCLAAKVSGKAGKGAKIAACVLLAAVTLWGGYIFVNTQDHTQEMEELNAELQASEEAMLQKQAEYAENSAAENAEWEARMAELTAEGEDIGALVCQLPMVCVGDSVMLGASGALMQRFPNCYIDAQKSRTAWVVNAILVDLKSKGMLNGTVVLHLGTNGDAPDDMKRQILDTCAGCDIFWINVTNDADVHVNAGLEQLLSEYDNAHYLDWKAYSAGHSEYFVADGIHLNEVGQQAYAEFVYGCIYDFYSARYTEQINAEIAELESERAETATFFGNSLLVSLYGNLSTVYPDAAYTADSDSESYDIVSVLTEASESGMLGSTVYVVTDKNVTVDQQTVDAAAAVCADRTLVLATESIAEGVAVPENVKLISLSGLADKGCYMADGIHLNDQGCQIYADAILN